MSTATAGAFSGGATLNLLSHDAQLTDLVLGAQSVQMVGTVNNLASAIFEGLGGFGSFDRLG